MTRFAQVSAFAILCAMSSVAAAPVLAQDAVKPGAMKSDAMHGKAMQHGAMSDDAMHSDAMKPGAKGSAMAKKRPMKDDAMQDGKMAPKTH